MLIRVPSWLRPAEMKLEIAANPINPVERLDSTGHYIDLGRLNSGTKINVEIPLLERVTSEGLAEKNHGGFGPGDVQDQIIYTIHWRGNYVTKLEPRGPYLPFFSSHIITFGKSLLSANFSCHDLRGLDFLAIFLPPTIQNYEPTYIIDLILLQKYISFSSY